MDVHHGIIWSNNASFFGLEFGTGMFCFGGESGIRTASTFEYRIPAKKSSTHFIFSSIQKNVLVRVIIQETSLRPTLVPRPISLPNGSQVQVRSDDRPLHIGITVHRIVNAVFSKLLH